MVIYIVIFIYYTSKHLKLSIGFTAIAVVNFYDRFIRVYGSTEYKLI